MADEAGYEEIWLEVSNVKIDGTNLSVQLRADRLPERPRWWLAMGVDKDKFKAVVEALDKKRPVLARIAGKAGGILKVTDLSIQYADTATVR